MKEINWGIIGCGDVTEVKSGPAFNMIEGSRLLAVMRRNGEKAKDYAARHNVPYWFDSAEKIINHPDINAVYIATPPSSHAEYAIQSLNAGKITYVEKPMAMNYRECVSIIEASEKSGAPLYVAYYRRHLDYFRMIRQLLDDGTIGKVRSAAITVFNPVSEIDPANQWRVNPEIAGGGYFVDLGSHALDLLDYLLGTIENASGIVKNQTGFYKAEDNVSAVFSFTSGITATGLWCFSSNQKIDEMTIYGESGNIRFSCFSFDPIVLQTKKDKVSFDLKPPKHIQLQTIEAVINEIRGGEASLCGGKTAARTSLIIDKILGH